MTTKYNCDLSDDMVAHYLKCLVNRFYKILPIREEGKYDPRPYMESLMRELLGSKSLMIALGQDDRYLSVCSLLQYMIDNNEIEMQVMRSEIFHAINLLNKMKNGFESHEE